MFIFSLFLEAELTRESFPCGEISLSYWFSSQFSKRRSDHLILPISNSASTHSPNKSARISPFSTSSKIYHSPANTAVHIHKAVKGRNGPSRIVFRKPIGGKKEGTVLAPSLVLLRLVLWSMEEILGVNYYWSILRPSQPDSSVICTLLYLLQGFPVVKLLRYWVIRARHEEYSWRQKRG